MSAHKPTLLCVRMVLAYLIGCVVAALAAEAELVLGRFPGRACLRTGCGEHGDDAEESCSGDHFGEVASGRRDAAWWLW